MSWDPSIPITEYTSHAVSCMYCASTLAAGITRGEAELVQRDHVDVHRAHYSVFGDTHLPEHVRPIDVMRERDYRIECTHVAGGGVSFDVHVRRLSDNATWSTRVRLEAGDKREIVAAFVEALRVALAAS